MDLTTKVLETWGPAGIVIVALSGALVVIWRRNADIQDKRIDEANDRAKQIGDLTKEVSVALATLTAAIASLRDWVMREKS